MIACFYYAILTRNCGMFLFRLIADIKELMTADATMVSSSTAGLVLVVCAVCLVLLSSANVADARPGLFSNLEADDVNHLFRSRRTPGFRQGAIDRVGHQFGKRSSFDDLLAPPAELPSE